MMKKLHIFQLMSFIGTHQIVSAYGNDDVILLPEITLSRKMIIRR